MLENYGINEFGVIFQKNYKKIDYNYDYSNKYNSYGELGNYMSYLRYAYIVGSIGKVPDSILDVGYGNGDFLKLCSEKINKCYGNDLSEYPVPDKVKKIDDIFSDYYEVICFFDAIEHFDDINFLNKLNCSYISISLPECHYFNDDWFFNWKHRRPNEHLWHFNKESLVEFMKSQGFELINISNIEDIIRVGDEDYSNIISGIFKKMES